MSKVSRVPKVYSEFDPPPDAGVDCSVLPSMTQQNFRDECDINNILARFPDTGLMDVDVNPIPAKYLDVASAVDFHTAQNLINDAKQVFEDLPLKVRRRFNGDIGSFLQFLDDPSNMAEAVELGLCKAPQEPSAGSTELSAGKPPEGAGVPKTP